ncbi:recombinase family protein [Paenibacillus sp. FSL L8-0708]|jgi:hypothetical protein
MELIVEGTRNAETEWIVVKDAHLAIIDDKLWNTAQSVLELRRPAKFK